MLSEMSSEEFAYWELLEQLEPFGERAEYMRNALLCKLLVDINRKPDSPPVDFDEFMPPTMRATPLEEEASASSGPAANPEAIRAIMEALMTKQNNFIAQQAGGAHA